MRVFTNLTPYIPLSFRGEGEEIYREGFRPSLTYTPPSLAKGRGQRDGLLNTYIDVGCIIILSIGRPLLLNWGQKYPWRLNECSRLMTSDE